MTGGEALTAKLTLIGAAGIGAQWLAWHLRIPAIILLAAAGVALGPGLGMIQPEALFGELLRPLVGVAVAIILFEGGLQLDRQDLHDAGVAVRRLVFLGAPLGWILTSLAAHLILPIAWETAFVWGGILIVTGPTVVLPLLRQSRVQPRPAAVLKWEGIMNDPIGALFAVVALQVIVLKDASLAVLVGELGLGLLAGTVVGVATGLLAVWAFNRGYVPESLKSSVLLALVLAAYSLADQVQAEAGLLATTVMGVTVANAPLRDLTELRRFKEDVAVVLIAGVFVVLTATLELSDLAMIDGPALLFAAVLIGVIRPLVVLLTTWGSELDWRDRALVAWIAPRGIVAVALAGVAGPRLTEMGLNAEPLVPLTFFLVFLTVLVQGGTLQPVGRLLGRMRGASSGVLIVGARPWSMGLARAIDDAGIPVTLADTDAERIRLARRAGLSVFHGEVLAQDASRRLDFGGFAWLLTMTEDPAYNALVCRELQRDFGSLRVLQVPPASQAQHHTPDSPDNVADRGGCRWLAGAFANTQTLMGRLQSGWQFQAVQAPAYPNRRRWCGTLGPETRVVAIKRPRRGIRLLGAEERVGLFRGDTAIVFTPAEEFETVTPIRRVPDEPPLIPSSDRLPTSAVEDD